MSIAGKVSVLITTWNSASHLESCLGALAAQDDPDFEVIVVDNASNDATRQILESFQPRLGGRLRVVLNSENVGFAAAQNQAIRESRGEWLLSLNPDVVASPRFVSALVAAGRRDERAGAVCGKLLRWMPETKTTLPKYTVDSKADSLEEIEAVRAFEEGAVPPEIRDKSDILDSTGIYFVPSLRHFDRGAEEPDRGQYDRMEYVFGATAAAALYRRAMVDDVSMEGQFFDEEFFAYREDADLAWRAQLLGWRCLYTPEAVAWHVRRVTPERFFELPHIIQWHSVKNRFLMRAKNLTFGLWVRNFPWIVARDELIRGYALLRDWSLLSAVAYRWTQCRGLRRKRKWIQSRRKVSDAELARWFRSRPASEPFPAAGKPPA